MNNVLIFVFILNIQLIANHHVYVRLGQQLNHHEII